jgi:hydroxymethylglutaryl-CoA lyase
MADSERVLEYLGAPAGIEIIGIVVNERGAERAIMAGPVHTLGFPYSISPEFLRRNQKQSQQESLLVLSSIAAMANKAGLNVVTHISMAFGNPYGEPWSVDEVAGACGLLIESGIMQISLADTVGVASPSQISETVGAVLSLGGGAEIGVHLHARPKDAAMKIRAAYQAGCSRFDAAIGGLGGCPFAQDALVGNIATETLLAELRDMGAKLPDLQPLDELIAANAEIAREYGLPPL